MKLFSFHIVLTALYFSESDGLSVSAVVPNPTTAIIVPPDITSRSVTLSWNYTLDSGEQLGGINVDRTAGVTNEKLVKYRSNNPSDNGVFDQFKSRMNFSISGDEIHLVINNLVVADGSGFTYECQVLTKDLDTESAVVNLNVVVETSEKETKEQHTTYNTSKTPLPRRRLPK